MPLPGRLPFLALLACPLLAIAAESASPAPEATFHLEPYRKTIALRGSVRGVPGLFLFDTGGGTTLLSPGFAKEIGCTPWGRLSGFRMTGDRLDAPRCDAVPITLGDTTFDAGVVSVFDIGALLPKAAAPVDGSLALDLFDGRTITIDFPAQRLYVESPGSAQARVKGATEFPAKLSREMQGRALAVSLGASTPQGPVYFEVDTGNGGTILVAKPYAKDFGLDPAKDGPQPVDFPLGPFRAKSEMGIAADITLDGNIGMPFLRDKVVTFDLRAGRLWIANGSGGDNAGHQ